MKDRRSFLATLASLAVGPLVAMGLVRKKPKVDALARYRDDPVAFVHEVLGVEVEPWQADMLRDHRIGYRVPNAFGRYLDKP